MKSITILVGIPCSGKSAWARKQIGFYIHSRDIIREQLFGKTYKQNKFDEGTVNVLYNKYLNEWFIDFNIDMILDNTHCKEPYIDDIIRRFKDHCPIRVVYFEIPLWKARLRNYIRWLKTGKWIPNDVMNSMYKNYQKINRKKYEHLVYL
jgi:predicted kinase